MWELMREIKHFLPSYSGIFLVEILLSSLRFSRSFIIIAVFEPLRACLEDKEVFLFFC